MHLLTALTEQELAEVVVRALEGSHWDVYQEVLLGGPVCDIVATSGPLVWAIEVKKAAGLAVLAQAHNWLRHAHLVSVAVPRSRGSSTRWFWERVAKQNDIGVIEVMAGGIEERHAAPMRRRVLPRLRNTLCAEHKTAARAGSAAGGYWTPFKRTKRHLERIVAEDPGVSMKDAISRLEHHYANSTSARAQVARLIREGVIDTIEIVKVTTGPHRGLYLQPRGWV